MKNKIKIVITTMIVAVIVSVGILTSLLKAKDTEVVFNKSYVAFAAQLPSGLDYRTIGCLDDSSTLTVRNDSIVFNYKGSKLLYKNLYNEKNLRFYGIRKDGVVVVFTKYTLRDGNELMVISQPEGRFILNPIWACPEVPSEEQQTKPTYKSIGY